MDIEKSYRRLSPYFDIWVKLMEIQSREMEVRDSKIGGLCILIISPPTDSGIKLLGQNNRNGKTCLLCFSAKTEKIAQKYLSGHKMITIINSHFFHIPFEHNFFDVIFTNCFFDFLQESEFDSTIYEIKRVLKNRGMLFSVHMDFPTDFLNHVWNIGFNNLSFVSQGCHPADIKPTLSKHGFIFKKDTSLSRFGFPVKYIQVKKQ